MTRSLGRAGSAVVSILLGLWATGCHSTVSRTPAPPAAERSVAPGINQEYLKEDVNVSQWVERFEREGREIYDHRDRIVEVAGVRPGMEVADIGAGSGLFTFLFADRVGRRGTVFAVDIVKDFLARIAREAGAAGRKNVRTVLCTERSAELPPRSIDLAFICDTYHHFEYPQSTLASIHRALRPGGELVLVEFKRIPGSSTDWILNHVRAGQEVFTAEIEAAGFKAVATHDFLKENYIVRFKKVGR